jgi:hypothetical protein
MLRIEKTRSASVIDSVPAGITVVRTSLTA